MDAAAYVRISLDKTGQELGVARQLEDARELAAKRGWNLLPEPYQDNDLSAFSGKRRPEFERMLEDIADGKVQAIIAWHPDRLYRRGRDLVRLIDTVQAAKCQIATVTAGDIDLNTASGRMQARIIGAVSEHESEHKAERQRRAFQQMRENGVRHGGGRSYGYTSKGMQVIPEEAAIIRELAARLLSGESAWSLAGDLTNRGVPTARGGARWNEKTIKDLMSRASLSGRVDYKYGPDGKRMNGRFGVIIGKGNWEPIIDEETSDKLRTLLEPKPATRRMGKGSSGKHLLAGIATCGHCGHPLWTQWIPKRRREDGMSRLYGCPARGLNGCGGTAIMAEPVDAFVTEAILQAVEHGALGSLLSTPDTEAIDQLERVNRNLEALAKDHGDGEITRGEWEAARAPLQARRKELERRVQVTRVRLGLDGLPDPLRPAWESGALTLAQQRAIISGITEGIAIVPPTTKGGGSRPIDRIRITWKA